MVFSAVHEPVSILVSTVPKEIQRKTVFLALMTVVHVIPDSIIEVTVLDSEQNSHRISNNSLAWKASLKVQPPKNEHLPLNQDT